MRMERAVKEQGDGRRSSGRLCAPKKGCGFNIWLGALRNVSGLVYGWAFLQRVCVRAKGIRACISWKGKRLSLFERKIWSVLIFYPELVAETTTRDRKVGWLLRPGVVLGSSSFSGITSGLEHEIHHQLYLEHLLSSANYPPSGLPDSIRW